MNAPRSPQRALAPWRLGDVFGLYGATAVGAIVLLLAWWGASGSIELNHQVTWVAVGVAGLLVSAVGNTAWLVSGRRNVGQRQQQLLQRWLDPEPAPSKPSAPLATTIVSAPQMTRYHEPGCPLVAGKPVVPVELLEADGTARRPCGVCQP